MPQPQRGRLQACFPLLTRPAHWAQDSFLPGVTRQTVADALERRFDASGSRRFRGRDLAGWYLQQVQCQSRCTHEI